MATLKEKIAIGNAQLAKAQALLQNMSSQQAGQAKNGRGNSLLDQLNGLLKGEKEKEGKEGGESRDRLPPRDFARGRDDRDLEAGSRRLPQLEPDEEGSVDRDDDRDREPDPLHEG